MSTPTGTRTTVSATTISMEDEPALVDGGIAARACCITHGHGQQDGAIGNCAPALHARPVAQQILMLTPWRKARPETDTPGTRACSTNQALNVEA